jgi:hypothetical protein
MTLQRVAFATVFALGLMTGPAWAHIPIFSSPGNGDTPENAVFIDDPTISHAVYHEMTEEAPQVWVTFDLQAGQEIYVQFGIPVLERLADFRPAVAVLGPGLPEIDLPFDIPDGLGGILFETDEIEEPEYFYEKFTATESWIFGEIVDTAAASGKHYVVAYDPADELGKLWVAVGRREVFEPQDIVALPTLVPQVRSFHEVEDPEMIPCFLFPAAAAFGALLLYVTPTWMRRRWVLRQETPPGDTR